MTIKELIQELQTYPQDMFVVTYCSRIDEDIEFRVVEEFYNGDSANPNCEIIYNNVLELI